MESGNSRSAKTTEDITRLSIRRKSNEKNSTFGKSGSGTGCNGAGSVGAGSAWRILYFGISNETPRMEKLSGQVTKSGNWSSICIWFKKSMEAADGVIVRIAKLENAKK